jgi:DNA polymerase III alpha subunit
MELKDKIDYVLNNARQNRIDYLKKNAPENVIRFIRFELKYLDENSFQELIMNKKYWDLEVPNKSNSILIFLFTKTKSYINNTRCESVVSGSGPDIDTDFSPSGKDVIIKKLQEKYGDLGVIRPTTYTPYSVKSTVVDFTKALGGTFDEGRAIAEALPDSYRGKATTWKDISADPTYAAIIEANKELFECVAAMDKQPMNQSQHASAVIISNQPADEFIPLRKVKTEKDDLGNWYYLSQWEATSLEKYCNYIKFDVLVIDNLDLNLAVCKAIGKSIKWLEEEIPEDDSKTFALINAGFNGGVFQMEEDHVYQVIKEAQPKSIEDIAAISALIRPGPKDSGLTGDWIEYKKSNILQNKVHPFLDATLLETGGVLVYQEQVMAALSELAGFDLATADNVRRAMGKKDPVEMKLWQEKFVTGCKAHRDISEETALYVWNYIDKFSSYGFNKPHALAYGLLAYQNAYLKAHYPAEFMIALMSLRFDKPDKLKGYIDESRRMGLNLLPPDVNNPHEGFQRVDETSIRFGLNILKGIGKKATNSIVTAANKGFDSFFGFLNTIDRSKVNSGVLGVLAKAGAMDSFGYDRASIVKVLPDCLNYFNELELYNQNQEAIVTKTAKVKEWEIELKNWEELFKKGTIKKLPEPTIDESGTKQIYTEPKPKKPIIPKERAKPEFPSFDDFPEPRITLTTVLWEGIYCGLYISGHPLDFIKPPPSVVIDPISSMDAEIAQAGKCLAVISHVEEIQIKRGKMKGRYLNVCTIEDKTGITQLTLFPSTVEQYKDSITPGSVIYFNYTVDTGSAVLRLKQTGPIKFIYKGEKND